MKRLVVWHHKDGAKLAIIEIPWWVQSYEWIVNKFCPCCGWRGWLLEKLDRLFRTGEEYSITGFYFSHWNDLFLWPMKFEKELLVLPIEDGCVTSVALWGLKKNDYCWKDNCSVHLSEDAMIVKYDN